jgi:mannose-1-phosphate guanylyltransferase
MLNSSIKCISEFKEKPSAKKAKEYICDGYYWNSGMVFIRLYDLEGLLKSTPLWEYYKEWSKHQVFLPKWCWYKKINKDYKKIKNISFDNLVLGNIKSNGLVLKSSLKWSDIGTWDKLKHITGKDREHFFRTNDKCQDCDICE